MSAPGRGDDRDIAAAQARMVRRQNIWLSAALVMLGMLLTLLWGGGE